MVRLLFSLIIPISFIAATVVSPAHANEGRKLSLAWEKDPKAAEYELKFEKTGSKRDPITFKTKSTSFGGVLVPGEYLFSLRAIDSKGNPGVWSEAQDFAVKPLEIVPILPESKSVISTKDHPDLKVPFSWQKSPGAAKYALSIRSHDGSVSKEIETSETKINVTLVPGISYAWRVVAFTRGETQGDAMKESASFVFEKPTLQTVVADYNAENAMISWAYVENAESYMYAVYHKEFFSEEWTMMTSETDYNQTSIVIGEKFSPGQYKVKISAVSKSWNDSPTAEVEFTVKPKERVLASIEDEVKDVKENTELPKKEALDLSKASHEE